MQYNTKESLISNITKFANLEDLADFIDGKAWQKSDKYRIYFDGYGRDITAYLEFESDHNLEIDENGIIKDSVLKVYTNCEQSINWKINRCKQVKFEIMKKLNDLIGCPICDSWEQVIL